jgi:hypothetical protein
MAYAESTTRCRARRYPLASRRKSGWYHPVMVRTAHVRPLGDPPLGALPGGELVAQGLEDWRRGVESVASLVVQVGARRLRQVGLELPADAPSDSLPEHRLYELLAREHGEAAHGRYNALLRQLVSFARARACAR